MANCKDCIHYDVCESDSEDVALNLTWANKCQHFKDKADVVPKSEVKELRKANIELELKNQLLYDEGKVWFEKCKTTKAEVAREIFEEMQSCLIQRHWNGLDIVSFEFDAVKYAELKKKYTESEGN